LTRKTSFGTQPMRRSRCWASGTSSCLLHTAISERPWRCGVPFSDASARNRSLVWFHR
jgi:hypothetical protein